MNESVAAFTYHPDHICTVVKDSALGFAFRANCSCGGQWRHSAQTSRDEMHSIYKSHLSYFNRPAIQPL